MLVAATNGWSDALVATAGVIHASPSRGRARHATGRAAFVALMRSHALFVAQLCSLALGKAETAHVHRAVCRRVMVRVRHGATR